MEIVVKCYTTKYKKNVQAVLDWTPEFLELIVRKFGLNGRFTAMALEEFFRHYTTRNAIRLRLRRLYRNGWFIRRLEGYSEKRPNRLVNLYQLSDSAKKYQVYWGGFECNERSPLMRKIPA